MCCNTHLKLVLKTPYRMGLRAELEYNMMWKTIAARRGIESITLSQFNMPTVMIGRVVRVNTLTIIITRNAACICRLE